jgi:hypothetical protein
MNRERSTWDRRAVGAWLIAAILSGASGGCSERDSSTLDVRSAKAALAKRKGDYGEPAGKVAQGK